MTSSVVMLDASKTCERRQSGERAHSGLWRSAQGGRIFTTAGASHIIRNVQYARRAAERVRSSRSGGLRGEYLQQRQVNRRLPARNA